MDNIKYTIEFFKDGTATISLSSPYTDTTVRTGGVLSAITEAISTLKETGVMAATAALKGYISAENSGKPLENV